MLTFVADKDCCEVHCTHDLLCRRLLACGPVLVQMCAGPWCRCAPVPGVDVRRSLGWMPGADASGSVRAESAVLLYRERRRQRWPH